MVKDNECFPVKIRNVKASKSDKTNERFPNGKGVKLSLYTEETVEIIIDLEIDTNVYGQLTFDLELI